MATKKEFKEKAWPNMICQVFTDGAWDKQT